MNANQNRIADLDRFILQKGPAALLQDDAGRALLSEVLDVDRGLTIHEELQLHDNP